MNVVNGWPSGVGVEIGNETLNERTAVDVKFGETYKKKPTTFIYSWPATSWKRVL